MQVLNLTKCYQIKTLELKHSSWDILWESTAKHQILAMIVLTVRLNTK